jgi:hypothetical protein
MRGKGEHGAIATFPGKHRSARRFAGDALRDIANHKRGPGFFTAVAAASVLG